MFIGILVVSAFALLCLSLVKKHFRQLQLSSRLKGPTGLPVFGNGLELANKTPIGRNEKVKKFKVIKSEFLRVH